MSEFNIALLKGDGIGPEIIDVGTRVLDAVANVEGLSLRYTEYPFCSDYYIKHGVIITDEAIREFKASSAIFFGALGDPRITPGVMELDLILRVRFDLDQYINLRPVKLYPNVNCPLKGVSDLDFYIIRENSEDMYNGMNRKIGGGKTVTNMGVVRGLYKADFSLTSDVSPEGDYGVSIGFISRSNSERTMKYGFELAEQKNKDTVTCVHKINIFPEFYKIWKDAFNAEAAKHPDIKTNDAHVDAMTMWLVKNPQDFGVVVAPNLFGDIITDLAAAISGGLGFAAGGNICPGGVSMFEPIHGSAPKYTGMNVINPIATVLSGAMMLETLGEKSAAKRIDDAVCTVLANGSVRTKDMGGTTKTSEVGDLLVKAIYDSAR